MSSFTFLILWVAFWLLRLRSAAKKQTFQGSGVKAPSFLRYASELAALPLLLRGWPLKIPNIIPASLLANSVSTLACNQRPCDR